jgi:hypothetical protein|tara:strand:+ start:187 stop:534 length:348 start_codon:yes stop_codon:yes gene_type:complete
MRSRLTAFAITGILIFAAFAAFPAWAANIKLEVKKVHTNYQNWPTVIMTVTNQSIQTVEWALVECSFLDGGSPVASATGVTLNVWAGETSIIRIVSKQRGFAFDDASCRLMSTKN